METHPNYPNNTENSAVQQPTLTFLPFIPLRKEIKNLPPFPINCLPPKLRECVQAVAVHTQTPVDMAAGIALGVLAGCLQGKVRVEGNIDHYEQCSLYTLIIAPPGERKSATISAMTSVIADYEQAFNERQKMCRGKYFKKAADFIPTIQLLLAYGYVATLIPPYLGTGRPPQEMLYVNPELYANPEAL